jgi:hypothetical protein
MVETVLWGMAGALTALIPLSILWLVLWRKGWL